MPDKFYSDKDFIKIVKNFIRKYWLRMVLLISVVCFIIAELEYPYWNTLFIVFNIGFLLFIGMEIKNLNSKTHWWRYWVFFPMPVAWFINLYFKFESPWRDSFLISITLLFLLLVAGVIIRKSEYPNAELWIMLLLGIISLQAAWPIFMPRISLEDINQERGIIYADKSPPQPQTVREAIIRVKPPLFPLEMFMNQDYPIANNLTEIDYKHGNPSLEISNSHDGRNINIRLNRITGWSFDEITGKIFYQADEPFILPQILQFGDKNIDGVYAIHNMWDYEKYPYNYAYSFRIENRNDFPIEIYNISFSIYNNTGAWGNLKKWTDDGFCFNPFYSPSNGSSALAEVNGNLTPISGNMFSSSKISLQIRNIPLEPHETKFQKIIFQENVCGDIIKDNSSYTSYNISGTVKVYNETLIRNVNYFIILIRNMNTTKLGTTYAIPNTQYKYDLASLPGGYTQGDVIQINVCENVQNCTASKNITVDIAKVYNEVNFP